MFDDAMPPAAPHGGARRDAEGALVLLSGGQDSATCLAWALERFGRVETIGFSYGQRHSVEMEARERVRAGVAGLNAAWAARLGQDTVTDLSGYGALAQSALTADQEIVWEENQLPTTFVPGRNLVFLAVAAALAYRRGLVTMVAGMCEADAAGYPDCRSETLQTMAHAITLGLDRPMQLRTPLIGRTKADTWALAERLGGTALVDLIVEESHTCYRGERGLRHEWGYGCGACPACEERARGWAGFQRGRAPA